MQFYSYFVQLAVLNATSPINEFYSNEMFYIYAPLEKGGILFCNCRSVGMSVGRSVGRSVGL